MNEFIRTFQERNSEWMLALGQHLQLSLLALLSAVVIAIPVAAGILYPFTGFYIDPLIAAVLMSISTVIVSINAMGLRYDKK